MHNSGFQIKGGDEPEDSCLYEEWIAGSNAADLSACGCVTFWTFELVDGQLLDVTACGRVSLWICQLVDVSTCDCVSLWMCQVVDVSACGCVSLRMCQSADESSSGCASSFESFFQVFFRRFFSKLAHSNAKTRDMMGVKIDWIDDCSVIRLECAAKCSICKRFCEGSPS